MKTYNIVLKNGDLQCRGARYAEVVDGDLILYGNSGPVAAYSRDEWSHFWEADAASKPSPRLVRADARFRDARVYLEVDDPYVLAYFNSWWSRQMQLEQNKINL